MATWLDVLAYAAAALVLAELTAAAVRRWRSVIVLDPALRRQLCVWPLRIVAVFGVLTAVAIRAAHAAGYHPGWIDAVTAGCLALSLGMLLASWNLARRR